MKLITLTFSIIVIVQGYIYCHWYIICKFIMDLKKKIFVVLSLLSIQLCNQNEYYLKTCLCFWNIDIKCRRLYLYRSHSIHSVDWCFRCLIFFIFFSSYPCCRKIISGDLFLFSLLFLFLLTNSDFALLLFLLTCSFSLSFSVDQLLSLLFFLFLLRCTYSHL